MESVEKEHVYFSFLVRLWMAEGNYNGIDSWQIEVESIQTGHLHQFPDLESLIGFLRSQLWWEDSGGSQGTSKE